MTRGPLELHRTRSAPRFAPALTAGELPGSLGVTEDDGVNATIRRYRDADRPTVWTLSQIPHLGATADPSAPLDLPPRSDPGPWGDLWDVQGSWIDTGGDFLVCEVDSRVVAMGGVMPDGNGRAEINHVRVHPALRRLGLGRMVMDALERRAIELNCTYTHLDTTVEQPEAVSFYRALGYTEVGRERHPDWELIFFTKELHAVANR